jgi:hypothetical protein
MRRLRTHSVCDYPAPISQLPDELLCAIFSYCLLSIHDNPKNHRVIVAANLLITRVCRRWRRVSLGSSNLWSRIPCFNARVTKLFLARSGTAPITVISHLPDSESLATALSDIGRARRISVQTSATTLKQSESAWSSPAPLLERCSLSLCTGWWAWLPENFLGSTAPRLRYLHFDNVAVDWASLQKSGIIQHLRELQVESVPSMHRPGPETILALIECMPSLESLFLSDALLNSDTSKPRPLRSTVVLSRLSYLYIAGPTAAISEVLEHVNAPPTARIRFYLNLPGTNDGLLTFLSRHVSEHGNRGPVHYIRHSKHSHAWLRGYSNSNSGNSSKLVFDLTLHPRDNVSAYYDALPLAQLQELEIIYDSDEATLQHVFDNCPNVLHLTVSSPSASETVVRMLSPSSDPEMDVPGRAGRLFLPMLRRIVLRAAFFGVGVGGFCQDLQHVMVARHAVLGIMLSVDIKCARRIRECHIQALRDVAGASNLHWDGELGLDSSEDSSDEAQGIV